MCHYGNIINFRSYRKRALQSNLIIAHGFLVQEEETVMQLLEYFIFCSAAANERYPDGRFLSESLLMKRKPNLQPHEDLPHSSASPMRLLTAAHPQPSLRWGGAHTRLILGAVLGPERQARPRNSRTPPHSNIRS